MTTLYIYDADGNLSAEEIDNDIDGVVNGRVSYGYDPDGTLRFTDSEFELDAWRETYEYNDAGDRVSIEFIWGEGLHTNALDTCDHDPLGNVIAEEQDWDTDGIADQRISWEYDGCNPLTETRGLAMASPQVFTYAYDEQGNLVTLERDDDADGEPEARTTYSHDANGKVVLEEYDGGADGTVAQRTTYTYDAAGNRLTEQRDDDLDGTPEFSATHAYQCP